MLSINSRGQIVIPNEVRNRANIRDGDKLALVSWMNRDGIYSPALIRADNLSYGASGVMQAMPGDNNEGVT